ncbi:MAG: serine/threonine-protein kinase [Planctomycetota bacterium]
MTMRDKPQGIVVDGLFLRTWPLFAMPMSDLSLKEYSHVVRRSGLLTSEELQEQYMLFTSDASISSGEHVSGTLGNKAQPQQPEAFARFLEEIGLLTPWQNANLLQGRTKGLVFGKFRVMNLLGVGGMGRVFLAQDRMLRRNVALKVLPRNASTRHKVRERFHREAQSLARLNHENIVRVYDVDVRDQTHYIVMEYVEGTDLYQKVKRQGPLDESTAADTICQVAAGLAHAHEANLIHRDIKPANLLLDREGTVKISDLGLALLQSDEDGSITEDPTKALGTADYISPEQALNSHDIDARTDIYSLGCSLYFLLTGKPPFAEGTNAQRLLAHQLNTARPINAVRAERGLEPIGEHMLRTCTRMMAKDPQARFESAAELEAALRPFAGDASKGSRHSDATTDTIAALGSDTKINGMSSSEEGSTKDSALILGAGLPSDPSLLEIQTDDRRSNVGSRRSNKRRQSRGRRELMPYLIAGLIGVPLLGIGVYVITRETAAPVGVSRDTSTPIDNAISSRAVNAQPTRQYYVVGRSEIYHVEGCRHLEGKENIRSLLERQLHSLGLRPCKVCQGSR